MFNVLNRTGCVQQGSLVEVSPVCVSVYLKKKRYIKYEAFEVALLYTQVFRALQFHSNSTSLKKKKAQWLNLKVLSKRLELLWLSESKHCLSWSFYWGVQGRCIISDLVGFRTDTEVLLKNCLPSVRLTSITSAPCRYKPFLVAAVHYHTGRLNLWLFSSQASMMDD